MPLEIFINETKEHGGILLGNGQTNNGEFRIVVQVPTDIQVGKYQVLAHALPFEGYLDSWSDPPIIIRSETETTLEGPDSVTGGAAEPSLAFYERSPVNLWATMKLSCLSTAL